MPDSSWGETTQWGKLSLWGNLKNLVLTPPLTVQGDWGLSLWGLDYWGGADTQLPEIGVFYPTCESVNIPRNTHISFCMVDPAGAGIDLTCTEVSVTIGTGAPVFAFTGGAFQAGWAGSSLSPVLLGAIVVGYCFDIVSDSPFPYDTEICTTVVACDKEGDIATRICCFRTVQQLSMAIELISLTRLQVTFSNMLKTFDLNAGITNLSNWIVRPVHGNATHSGRNQSIVRLVIPEQKRNPTFVLLDVQEMIPHQRYEVIAKNFVDIFGQTFAPQEAVAIEARRTKVDSILDGLPRMYEGRRVSNLFWVLAGIAKQDEIIGGNKAITPGSNLQGLY